MTTARTYHTRLPIWASRSCPNQEREPFFPEGSGLAEMATPESGCVVPSPLVYPHVLPYVRHGRDRPVLPGHPHDHLPQHPGPPPERLA